jgi:hypothetical protein
MVVVAGNLALPMLMIYPQVCPRVLHLEQKIKVKYFQPNSRLGLTYMHMCTHTSSSTVLLGNKKFLTFMIERFSLTYMHICTHYASGMKMYGANPLISAVLSRHWRSNLSRTGIGCART